MRSKRTRRKTNRKRPSYRRRRGGATPVRVSSKPTTTETTTLNEIADEACEQMGETYDQLQWSYKGQTIDIVVSDLVKRFNTNRSTSPAVTAKIVRNWLVYRTRKALVKKSGKDVRKQSGYVGITWNPHIGDEGVWVVTTPTKPRKHLGTTPNLSSAIALQSGKESISRWHNLDNQRKKEGHAPPPPVGESPSQRFRVGTETEPVLVASGGPHASDTSHLELWEGEGYGGRE
jgi:hypothetical protein